MLRTKANFLRQQAKIVHRDRRARCRRRRARGDRELDQAHRRGQQSRRRARRPVRALNAEAGPGTWRFVTSPTESVQAGAVADCRTSSGPAFIYKPDSVTPVGASDLYLEESANASGSPPACSPTHASRWPRRSRPRAPSTSDAFAVVANHFKSKGDSTPPATGDNANGEQGAFNGDRTRQAAKLVEFADGFAEARGIEAVFLAGDLNSYTEEDPMHVLYDAGYDPIESPRRGDLLLQRAAPGRSTTSSATARPCGWSPRPTSGTSTPASRSRSSTAASTTTPRTSGRATCRSRRPTTTRRSSASTRRGAATTSTHLQVVATNDFHGRLLADGATPPARRSLAGAVDQMREDNPDTVFAAAGDLIGASTFESFIQNDEPTIDALNAAGLEVSAAGNHEFDQGYEDLVGRVPQTQRPTGSTSPPTSSSPRAATTRRRDVDQGLQRAGRSTSASWALSPRTCLRWFPQVWRESPSPTSSTPPTRPPTELKADGADLVILLVHEGASQADCTPRRPRSTAFGHIVNSQHQGRRDRVGPHAPGLQLLRSRCPGGRGAGP